MCLMKGLFDIITFVAGVLLNHRNQHITTFTKIKLMLFLHNQRHHCIIERTVKSQDYLLVVLSRYSAPFQFQPVNNLSVNS